MKRVTMLGLIIMCALLSTTWVRWALRAATSFPGGSATELTPAGFSPNPGLRIRQYRPMPVRWQEGRSLVSSYVGAVENIQEPELAGAPPFVSQTCLPPPPQMISWWPGDGNANDIQGSNPGTLQGNVTFADGMVGQAFGFNGVDGYVNVPASDSLTIQTALTIEAWVKPSNPVGNGYQWVAGKSGRYGIDVEPDGRVRFGLEINVSWDNVVISVHPLAASTWSHVVGTYDPATGLQEIYLNGVLDNSRQTSGPPKGRSGSLQIGGLGSGTFFNEVFSGLIDEVRLFGRALSDSEILAIYSASSAGLCKGNSGGGGGSCSLTVLPGSQPFGPGGGVGSFHVAASPTCNWTVVSNDPFITLTSPGSGNGSGTVDFTVAAYNGDLPRSGSLTFNNTVTANVVQAGLCIYEYDVTPTSFDKPGGSGTITMTTYNNCDWQASSSASWIHFASPSKVTGPGSVNFTVDPNNGNPAANPPQGFMRAAGISPDFGLDLVSIFQQGYMCDYNLQVTSSQGIYPQAGAQDSLNVVAPNTGACTWMARSNDRWITVTAGQTGNGNGTVSYSLAPNSGPFRTGSIDVAGLTQNIEQAGCQFTITPQGPLTTQGEQLLGPSAGTGSITVTTDSHCIWQASSTVDWITLAGESTGPQTGSKTLHFNVAANSSSEYRYGKIHAGDQSVSVLQKDASGCYYEVIPNTDWLEGGGAGSRSVDAPSGCEWTAESRTDWLQLTDSNGGFASQIQGSGPGTIHFEGPEFVVEFGHSGTIVVNGYVFATVNLVDPKTCWLSGLTHQALSLKPNTLPVAHRLRDEVLIATPRGQLYTQLYYHFSLEAIRLTLSNPKLLLHSTQLLARYLPVIDSLVKNKTASLDEADLLEMESLLNEFAAGASPEFLTTLYQLKKDLHDPRVHREFNLRVQPRANPK